MKSIYTKYLYKNHYYNINSSPNGNFFMPFCCLLIFLKINFFGRKIFQEYHQSVRLDPDHAQNFVGPGLGPNCLQRLSADNTSR